jgi:hypothetical protein
VPTFTSVLQLLVAHTVNTVDEPLTLVNCTNSGVDPPPKVLSSELADIVVL